MAELRARRVVGDRAGLGGNAFDGLFDRDEQKLGFLVDKVRMSHGHATRSTFTLARVIHFMGSPGSDVCCAGSGLTPATEPDNRRVVQCFAMI